MKRFLSLLLALSLCLSCVSALAESSEKIYSFDALLSSQIDYLSTAGEAIKSSNRAKSAATLMLEFLLHLTQNGEVPKEGYLWRDCVIGRDESILSFLYEGDDDHLLLIAYDTFRGKVQAGYIDGTSMYVGRLAIENKGFTVYTIDGDDWTDILQELLSIVMEALEE